MNKIANNVIDLIGNTPLIRLNRIMNNVGKGLKTLPTAEILGKLEFFNPGGSVKDRPCLEMIEDAERRGILKNGSTVIEPTTGNTGIGLAMICAVKGYRCILTIPKDLSLERIYLFNIYGAEAVQTPAQDGVKGAIKKAKELAAKIPDSFMPLQFQSQANPEAHRKTTAKEILNACEGKLDAFVTGVGTGGTITGVGEKLKENIPSLKVVAVEPQRSAVLSGRPAGSHRIQGIGAGFIPEILNRDIIDEIIAIDDKEAFEMTRRLGKEEGLCVGISSGAAVVASVKVAQQLGEGKRVLVVLCDTGERYFSMEQYFMA